MRSKMRTRGLNVWLSFLIMGAMIVVAGCAARPGAGEVASTLGEGAMVLDLPAIVLEFDANGEGSFGGVALAALAGEGAEVPSLPPDTLEQVMSNNIQHIQINNRVNGLTIRVNGLRLPSLNWDGESLQSTAAILEKLGEDLPALDKLLPMMRSLGVGIVLQFPVAEGTEAIPLAMGDDGDGGGTGADDFVSSVGAAPKINLPIFYADDGTYTIGNMTGEEWNALTGMPLADLNLDSEQLESIKNAGVSQVSISTNAEGIFIGIDGQMLPHLGWENGELGNLVQLASQMGLLDSMAEGGDMGELIAFIEELLPMVQATDFTLTANFPS